ncbi:MAG: 50S ribosomal protein L32e [Promethearchaeota archaeon]|jgi:large subunit ribosomal protein L32e|nr:50S ribosomal protein L32e [Candidatus Lokiarchaeota archaeon]
MEQKRLIELRKKINKKRPSFRRVESWRYKRVKDSWRKARGIDSRTRIKSKSGVKSPSAGYRGPKKVRGLHPSGYEEARVHNINDLKDLNNKKHAIKISTNLGVRKRIRVIDYAQSRGFKILNLGISQRELDSLEAALEFSIEDLEDEDLLEDED